MEMFGLNFYKLFDLFSNTPDKVNAFISTIIKITRNYQMRNEHFYQAALRSYQDMYDNYFEEIEMAVKAFRKENKIKRTIPCTTNLLESVLKKKFKINVERKTLPQKDELTSVRSFFSNKTNTLFINKKLTSAQENFLLGRELGFQYLNIEERPFVTRIIEQNSFEELFNNFKASYFSAALLMEEEEMARDIRSISGEKKWHEKPLLSLLKKYDVTPEMLLQRMTNILPKHFGINDLFFLRLYGESDLKRYRMTKELHLSQLHSPYGNVRNEHYCRRWISINIIKRLRASRKNTPIADAQISKYWETPNEYLCLSIAKPDQASSKASVSVTIGLLLTDAVRRLFGYLDDQDFKKKDVNTTCERCSMPNCGARAMPPIVIEEEEERIKVLEALKELE